MKTLTLLLIVCLFAGLVVLVVVLMRDGDGQPLPMASRPASVEARLTEAAERLQGTVRSVEKTTVRAEEHGQSRETELYKATITAADGKVWSLTLLPDGKVLEMDERLAEERVRDTLWNWFLQKLSD